MLFDIEWTDQRTLINDSNIGHDRFLTMLTIFTRSVARILERKDIPIDSLWLKDPYHI